MKTERIVKSLLEMLNLDASEFVRLMVRFFAIIFLRKVLHDAMVVLSCIRRKM